MILTAVRSFRNEPRATDPPAPGWHDGLLVGLVVVAALLEGALARDVAWRPAAVLVAVGLAPLLLVRRAQPLVCVMLVFGTTTALSLVGLLNGVTGIGLNTMIYVLVFVFALVRWGSGREIAAGLVVVAIAALSSIATDEATLGDFLGAVAVLAAAVAGGAALRYRDDNWRRESAQIRSEERVGIARELHDTVAHHVSAITVQAQAGRAMAQTQPAAALEVLSVIETEAVRALAEMRAMVRVLRDGTPAEYGPQLGVAGLAALAGDAPSLIVDVVLTGDLTHLPPQIDAAVYRIAQESLTNALRHARHASRVQISVIEGGGQLRIRVTNDGRVESARPPSHGFGLLGMAERAHLLGGSLSAGPAAGGGWVVDAVLPTESAR